MMKVNCASGYLASQARQQVGGVAARVFAQIGLVELERAVGFDGAQDHRAAMRGIGLRFVAIVRIAGRNEEHAVESLEQPRGLGDEEMRVVNGIERPAENADFHE